jgi:hypothetical protein
VDEKEKEEEEEEDQQLAMVVHRYSDGGRFLTRSSKI